MATKKNIVVSIAVVLAVAVLLWWGRSALTFERPAATAVPTPATATPIASVARPRTCKEAGLDGEYVHRGVHYCATYLRYNGRGATGIFERRVGEALTPDELAEVRDPAHVHLTREQYVSDHKTRRPLCPEFAGCDCIALGAEPAPSDVQTISEQPPLVLRDVTLEEAATAFNARQWPHPRLFVEGARPKQRISAVIWPTDSAAIFDVLGNVQGLHCRIIQAEKASFDVVVSFHGDPPH